MAQLVNAIDSSGEHFFQIHDIVYPEPRDGDSALEGALASSSGAVVAQVPVLASGAAAARVGGHDPRHRRSKLLGCWSRLAMANWLRCPCRNL